MRYAVIPFTALILALSAAAVRASVGPAPARALAAGPGIAASVFRVDGELERSMQLRIGERLPRLGTRLAIPAGLLAGPPSSLSGSGGGASWTRKNTAIAVLASAVLPGMGELYCYRASRDGWTLARVPAFLAVEGYLWYSYADNHKTGKDYKRDYEAYADAHWSLDKFLQDHPCCQGLDGCESWQEYNDGCKTDYNYFFYTPKEADREEYYENIGKYNAFVFGWDDCTVTDPADPNFTYWTPRRTEYVSMRNASDDYLLKADHRLMGLIVNRVVSMIDTGWLAYRLSKGADPNKGWSLRFRTFGDAPTIVVNRRF